MLNQIPTAFDKFSLKLACENLGAEKAGNAGVCDYCCITHDPTLFDFG